MTIFNGIDQHLVVSGMTAGVRIRLHLTPLTAYDITRVDRWYDAVGGSGYARNNADGGWAKSNFTLRVSGVGIDPLLATTMDDGVTPIELDLGSGGAGSGFYLFATESGLEPTPMEIDYLEIRDSGNVNVIHHFDLSAPASNTINDSVGSATLELIGFNFSATIDNIDTDNDVYPSQAATITGELFGATQGTVTLGGEAQTVTAWTDTSIPITVVQGDLKYGEHELKVILP